MNTLLVICGLTATGKTSLAGEVAIEFDGEVISVDSRQAYRYMDIGTGKDLGADSRFTLVDKLAVNGSTYQFGYYTSQASRIWLYDTATPDQPVHVALYYTLAWKAIKSCWERRKLPILVGGDGFYLQSILNPPASLAVMPNLALREALEQLPIAGLQQRLSASNPDRYQLMNESDRNNSRRLIRAIEIAESRESALPLHTPEHHPIVVGLSMAGDVLETRIAHRVAARIASGFETEMATLLEKYPQFYALPGSRTLGYAQWQPVLEGRIDQAEAMRAWIQAEVSYAKRQMTWFKKRAGIVWFDAAAADILTKTRILLGNS